MDHLCSMDQLTAIGLVVETITVEPPLFNILSSHQIDSESSKRLAIEYEQPSKAGRQKMPEFLLEKLERHVEGAKPLVAHRSGNSTSRKNSRFQVRQRAIMAVLGKLWRCLASSEYRSKTEVFH